MSKKGKRNTYFRQTPKSFKADKQTQIFSHINRSLPYKLYKISKDRFRERLRYAKKMMNKNKDNFLKVKKNAQGKQ